jgi:hypothetical protein
VICLFILQESVTDVTKDTETDTRVGKQTSNNTKCVSANATVVLPLGAPMCSPVPRLVACAIMAYRSLQKIKAVLGFMLRPSLSVSNRRS